MALERLAAERDRALAVAGEARGLRGERQQLDPVGAVRPHLRPQRERALEVAERLGERVDARRGPARLDRRGERRRLLTGPVPLVRQLGDGRARRLQRGAELAVQRGPLRRHEAP